MKAPEPRPLRPSYDSLWHLTAIGVMDRDGSSAAWEEASGGPPVRVAMIDTSVAVDHLNLVANINRSLALDLCSTRLGAFPYLPKEATLGGEMNGFHTDVADDLPLTSDLLAEFRKRLSPGQPALLGIQPATSPAFSNHGTAIAGLICATPARARVREGATIEGVDGTELDYEGQATFPLPYAGVNPFCEVVPISTTFDPDPEVLTLAFLYADMIGADVILLPRDVPDPGGPTRNSISSKSTVLPWEAPSTQTIFRTAIGRCGTNSPLSSSGCRTGGRSSAREAMPRKLAGSIRRGSQASRTASSPSAQ